MAQYKRYPKQLLVLMTEDQHAWLLAESASRRESAAELVRQAVAAMQAASEQQAVDQTSGPPAR